jgi:hypothetical protein
VEKALTMFHRYVRLILENPRKYLYVSWSVHMKAWFGKEI